MQPAASADSCSDLSGQNFTGQLPDAITRLRLLSSMCARVDSALVPLEPLAHAQCAPKRAPLCRCTAFAARGAAGTSHGMR